MSLPDDWFIDYDQQTLASKLKGVNYDVFAPAERDILPNELNKIEFSLVKYESILQRHFVAQHNVTHSFFNTESLVSEDSAFQLYAKTMLNFIKAEINYCYYFWQNERFLDHLVHRLDASLLRTYYFLLQLHKRLTRAGSNRRSVWTPDQSLEDMIEYLVVPLPDLAAFIQFFEKTFEDLYHKLSPLARSYQLELNLIIAIWTVSNMYIDYCFEDIVSVSSSKFSHKDEQTLKETLLGRNETFRVKQDEKPTETVNNEQDSLQKWLAGHVSNSAFVDNISQHAEKENFSLLESVFKREETTISEFEDLPSDNKSKGSFLERLHNNKSNNIPKQPYQRQVSRPKSSDQSMLSSASGLSSVSNMKFSTLGLSSLNSVKESPNNPLAKNSVMHSLLSDSADEHDLRAMIARSSKMNKKQQVISHFNHNILSKLDSDSDSRDQLSRDFNDTMLSSINKRSMYSMQQSNDDEYLRTMKSKLSENLYRTLIGEKEEQKYSEEELAKQRMQARAGGFLKSLQKSMKVSSMDDPNKLPHGNGGSRSADEMKSTADHNQEEKQKKEKQKKMRMEEEFLKLKIASETMMSEQLQYIPSKENKGDDIPDEEILKEIIDEEDSDDEDDKSEKNSVVSNEEGSDMGEEDDENKGSDQDTDSEDELAERQKKRRDRERREKARIQMMVSKNQFQEFFHKSIEKEPQQPKSKYFVSRRNFYYMREDDDINACRHKSKWCFLQDNYRFQSVEKDCHDYRMEDYAKQRAPMKLGREKLVQHLRRTHKTTNKGFPFSKENPMAIFLDIMNLMNMQSHKPVV